MLKRWLVTAILVLGLAGCGDAGTEVSARVPMAPADVYAALSRGSVADVAPMLPGIKVEKSRPSDNELVYTIPTPDDHAPATLRFRFEPLDQGTATNVVARVSTPGVKASIGGKMQMLSEKLVAGEVRKLLASLGPQSAEESARKQISALLVAVAIATNQELLEKAIAMSFDQSGLMETMLANAQDEADAALHEAATQQPNESDQFAAEERRAEQGRHQEMLADQRPETDGDY